ncbi:rRNA-processing protein FCF1-like protein [Iris pallida]|uniref:rRNA-processing protein FCF1-like protein n=1 Tax=Iris pallida TaxID=29817 RepID=A0AAX6I6X8_IRIPA|nr:rRNA-processing protein FCF1-like protein [Iris pallida]
MGKAKKGPKFAAVKRLVSSKTLKKYKEEVLNPKKKDSSKEKLSRNVPAVSSALTTPRSARRTASSSTPTSSTSPSRTSWIWRKECWTAFMQNALPASPTVLWLSLKSWGRSIVLP